jgi:hypothetical protein
VNWRSKHSRRAKRDVAQFYPYNTRRDLDAVKRLAGNAVRDAVRTGALKRQPCQECGAKAEAHHDDHSKPLDVQWLCRHHHRRRDAFLRDQRRGHRFRPMRRGPVTAPAPVVAQSRLEIPVAPLPEKRTYRSRVSNDCTIALVRQVTLEVAEALDAAEISENGLSRRLKLSRQAINCQFAGGFRSLKVLAAYADALDCDAWFVMRKRQSHRVAS